MGRRLAARTGLAPRLFLAALILGPSVGAAQEILLNLFSPGASRDCPPGVWFEGFGPGGLPALTGAAGTLSLGAQRLIAPNMDAIQGGYLSWRPEGLFLTLIGGGITTLEVTDPTGAPLADLQGMTLLGSALELDVTPAGDIVAVILHAGALLWSSEHLYLFLLGGAALTVEVFDPASLALDQVRGVVTLAGAILDTNPAATVVDASLFAGAAVYRNDDAHLFEYPQAASPLLTEELLTPQGAPLSGVRGLLPLGGFVSSAPPTVDALGLVWTATRAFALQHSGTPVLLEITDPTTAQPIAGVWATMRATTPPAIFSTGDSAVVLLTADRQYLWISQGGILSTIEVTDPAGGAIPSHVEVTRFLRQAGNLLEVAGRSDFGGAVIRGTILGVDH